MGEEKRQAVKVSESPLQKWNQWGKHFAIRQVPRGKNKNRK